MPTFLALCYIVPALIAVLIWGYLLGVVIYLSRELRK